MELWQVKNVTKFLAVTKIQLHFQNKCLQDAANLCSISRALKKLIITVSAIFLVVKEKRICGDPYFAFSFFLFFLLMYTDHICFCISLYVLKTMDS